MKYRKTKHAEKVLNERNISDEWLERVLENPELTEPDEIDPELEHRLGKIEEFGNRVLRVIINVRRRPVLIITAYFDRNMKGQV